MSCQAAGLDLFAADEVFLTGSGAGIVPVGTLDGRTLGSGRPGPLWEKLRRAFLGAALSIVAVKFAIVLFVLLLGGGVWIWWRRRHKLAEAH